MGTLFPLSLWERVRVRGFSRDLQDLSSFWDGKDDGRMRVGLAAWAQDMCSPALLRALRALQERLDVMATIHLNQIWGEVAAVQEQRGVRKAHLVPLLRVVSCFVHQGQARDVEAVMVDGRWLMRDGALCTMDEELIVREADRIGRAAWQRLFAEHPDLSPPRGMHIPAPIRGQRP